MARSSKKSKGAKYKSKISAEPEEKAESKEEAINAQTEDETGMESEEGQEFDEDTANIQAGSTEGKEEVVAGIDESPTLVEDTTDSKPSRKKPRYISELVLAVAVIVALIAGLLIGYQYGSSSPSLNPCGYGFSNTINGSLSDAIDAYQITAINASFSEINKTVGFCGSLTAQQQAFINNVFK